MHVGRMPRNFVFSVFASFVLGTAALLCADDAPKDKDKDSRPANERTEKRREEWNKLSPEERQARLKEAERRRQQGNKLTPEEREAKRKEIASRLDKRLAKLHEKEAKGTLTPDEAKELARCEQIRKRFDSQSTITNAPAEAPKPLKP
jgi:hypothetical protein